MARTKSCDRQSSPSTLPRSVHLGAGAVQLTLEPVPPIGKAGGARRGRGREGSRGSGITVELVAGAKALAAAAGGATALHSPEPAAAARAKGNDARLQQSPRSSALVGTLSNGGPLSPTVAVVAAVRGWQASPPTGGQLIRPPEGSPRSDRAMHMVARPQSADYPCTTCGDLTARQTLQQHPTLPAASCEKCVRYFLSDGQPDQWARHENGKEMYCAWCAHAEEGGGVAVECACGGCPKIFCKACIVRNFGESHYQVAKTNKAWQCYVCAPGEMQKLPSYELIAMSGPASTGGAPLSGRSTAKAGGARGRMAELPESRNQKKGSKLSLEVHGRGASDTAGGQAADRCSACGTCDVLVAHDLLEAKVCRSCFSSLQDVQASTSKDRPSGAEISCRWCGQSDAPTVSCFDVRCPSGGHGYCEHCITRNFSYGAWKTASHSYALGNWSCYACQPSPLQMLPMLGAQMAVSFQGEGNTIGRVIGVGGPGMTPGQLRVQFDPPGSEPWVIDPAAGHLFEVVSAAARYGSPKSSPTALKVTFKPSAAGTAGSGSTDLGPANWTDEMRNHLISLIGKDGPGQWQRKTELLGYGHTAKQVSNKWRSIQLFQQDEVATSGSPKSPSAMAEDDPFAQFAGAPRSHKVQLVVKPKVKLVVKPKKERKEKKAVPTVTVIHEGDAYAVPIGEAATANARGDRLEAKIRSVLQVVPGKQFVLMNAKGKTSFATAASQVGETFGLAFLGKRGRGGQATDVQIKLLSGGTSRSSAPQHLVSSTDKNKHAKGTVAEKIAAALQGESQTTESPRVKPSESLKPTSHGDEALFEAVRSFSNRQPAPLSPALAVRTARLRNSLTMCCVLAGRGCMHPDRWLPPTRWAPGCLQAAQGGRRQAGAFGRGEFHPRDKEEARPGNGAGRAAEEGQACGPSDEQEKGSGSEGEAGACHLDPGVGGRCECVRVGLPWRVARRQDR